MNLRNKKILFTLLIFLSLVLPLYRAHAFVTYLASLVASYIISVVLSLFAGISYYFLKAAVWFMGFVQSESFISWTYTGMDNPIMEVGWTLARDLTNMFFIIIMVFIGLATALKLDQYRYQQLIPKLIGVALLINFSPVITGAIIDFSNILTNFFLGQYSGGEFLVQFGASQRAIVANAFGGSFFNPLTAIGRVVQLLLLVSFNFVAALIYLLFSFVFAGRYVALWILVALSPFAFFSYAIPQLGSFWKQWWNNFIQWCLIGVSAGFFLYLGNHVLVRAPEMMAAIPPSSAGIEYFLLEFMYSIIPLSLGLGILIMGLMTALKSNATGAKWAIQAAKWSGAKVGGIASKQTVGRFATSQIGRNLLEGKTMENWKKDGGAIKSRIGAAGVKIQSAGKMWETMQSSDKGWVRAAGAIGGTADSVISPLSWAVNKGRRAALGYSIKERGNVDKAETALEKEFGKDFNALARHARTIPVSDWYGRTAAVQRLAKIKGGKALKLLPEGYVSQAVNQMSKRGAGDIMEIIKHMPQLVLGDDGKPTSLGKQLGKDLVSEDIEKELTKAGIDKTRHVAIAINKKILDSIKKNEDLSDDTLKSKDAQKALALFGASGRVKHIFENRSSEIQESTASAFTGSGKDIAELVMANQSMARRVAHDKTLRSMVDPDDTITPDTYKDLMEVKGGVTNTRLNSLVTKYSSNQKITDALKELGKNASGSGSTSPATPSRPTSPRKPAPYVDPATRNKQSAAKKRRGKAQRDKQKTHYSDPSIR